MQKNKSKFSRILLAGTLVFSAIYLGGADGCFGSSTTGTGSYSAGSSGTTSGTGVTCPTESGQTLCGYCDASSTSSHAGKCRYCASQYACKYTDVCTDLTCPAASSSGGGGTTGGGTGVGNGQAATNCSCPGNEQCSQVVGCLQSCYCYQTINGSDGASAWYFVKVNGTQTCYMCDQNGLAPNCTNAAQAAANAVVPDVAAGQCSS